jgi:hypothetical protein
MARGTFASATLPSLLLWTGCVANISKVPLEDARGEHARVSTGCGVRVIGGGDPIPMDALDADLGETPGAVARRLEGAHVVPITWQPWWSAEPPSTPALGALGLELTMAGTARKQGTEVDLDAQLRVRDALSVLALDQEVTFTVYPGGEAYASVRFDDVELARRLGLPPAADPSAAADTFELTIDSGKAGFQAWLSTLRSGNTCQLTRAVEPPKTVCQRYDGMLTMPESAVIETWPLRDELLPGFAPAQAIALLQAQGPLEVAWKDMPASRLHVSYEPAAEVCVTAGDIPFHTSPYDALTVPGYKVVIPLHAVLRTEDGRLLVRLSGFAETRVSEALGWDQRAEALLEYTPLAMLQPGERPGFVAPEGGSALLSAWIRTPIEDYELPSLGFTVCQLHAGVASYPAVLETAPNRQTCLCASTRGSQEALIRLVRGSP